MKLYDFDGMFDEKLSEYIARNSSSYNCVKIGFYRNFCGKAFKLAVAEPLNLVEAPQHAIRNAP